MLMWWWLDTSIPAKIKKKLGSVDILVTYSNLGSQRYFPLLNWRHFFRLTSQNLKVIIMLQFFTVIRTHNVIMILDLRLSTTVLLKLNTCPRVVDNNHRPVKSFYKPNKWIIRHTFYYWTPWNTNSSNGLVLRAIIKAHSGKNKTKNANAM